MSDKPKDNSDPNVSRRGLAGIIIGAATSVASTRAAVARPSNIVLDSSGRVIVDGAALSAPTPDERLREAKARLRSNNACNNTGGCTGSDNVGCSNTAACVKPNRAMDTKSGGSTTNSPNTNKNSSGGSKSRK